LTNKGASVNTGFLAEGAFGGNEGGRRSGSTSKSVELYAGSYFQAAYNRFHMTSTTTNQLPPPVRLNQMITGCWVTQTIYVAAELGIADLLKSESLTTTEIAARLGTTGDGLYRILRALASIGIFRENEGGQFEQTELSECLRSDVPGSMRAWARAVGANWCWGMMGDLLNSGRTGQKAPLNLWEHFEQNKDDGDIFNQAMTSFSSAEIGPILESYDFAGIGTLMDVAGGYGSLLAEVLEANPEMRSILFDAPSVIENARPHVAATKVADRCELAGGDFFTSVPSGADAIMMKHILHDWSDEDSLRILNSCHTALPAGGKLLVIESVIQPGNDPQPGKMLDIVMLRIGGKERTEAEFRTLLDAAGFDMTRIVATSSPVSVVEGRKR